MDRLLAMFNSFYNYSVGTLWKVREDLWKEKLSKDYNSSRKWHPALSVRNGKITTTYDRIPILFGTSKGKHKRHVVVKGVTREGGKNKLTFFGKFIVPMYMADFTGQNSQPRNLTGWELDSRPIVKNCDKPKLTDDEFNQLKNWMKKKGL